MEDGLRGGGGNGAGGRGERERDAEKTGGRGTTLIDDPSYNCRKQKMRTH
jgi:hypothetical protein